MISWMCPDTAFSLTPDSIQICPSSLQALETQKQHTSALQKFNEKKSFKLRRFKHFDLRALTQKGYNQTEDEKVK